MKQMSYINTELKETFVLLRGEVGGDDDDVDEFRSYRAFIDRLVVALFST